MPIRRTGIELFALKHTYARPVHPSWTEALASVEPQLRELGNFLRAENAAGRGYLPPGDQILNAFSRPMGDVKVLIVGQDPYPTPGHAMGLSFSVAPEVRPLPKSLINIFKELHEDVGINAPASGDLTPWADQGVMLLNRVLTVSPGKPASHQGRGWEEYTGAAIEALARRNQPLVAILWGKHAQSARSLLGSTPVITSPHPSPLSAHRGFFGSKPFSRANALLAQQGAEPIDWSL